MTINNNTIQTVADHVLIEKLKGCAYGDYKKALQSLETAFQRRIVTATFACSTGNQDAIDSFLSINELIKKALFL